MKADTESTPLNVDQLVSAEDLLEILWPAPNTRPSLRWLRQLQQRRAISHLKIGRRVFFDPATVRAELVRKFTVEAS